SLESVQPFTDPHEGVPAVVEAVRSAMHSHLVLGKHEFAPGFNAAMSASAIKDGFSNLVKSLDRPLVVFFDEADCLSNGTLISFLRQLRDGYVNRIRAPFIHSCALVGMRNIRDYKAKVRDDNETLGSASPFNVVTEALTLKNFTREEIAELYGQHTDDTGQVFAESAIDRVHYWTEGQPWLVNAIAREAVEKICRNDFSVEVTVEMIDQAAYNLVLRRDTHIDSLLERLKEPRVRRVIEPVILGEGGELHRLSDDYEYVRDLGLIREERGKTLPANPIYAEVIGRVLSYDSQQNMMAAEIGHDAPFYLDDSGRFDMRAMLSEFQQFWRENSDAWLDRFDYREAAPHLILMGFLQRVLNGGGRVVREMAAGTGRLDLCVEYGNERYPIELKLYRGEKTVPKGLHQLGRYLDTLGEPEGWLIVFDQRPDVSWDDKIYWRTEPLDAGKTIHIVGC
ncbi:MAG: ATP-binding protein, partial [bacterium]